MKPEEMDRLIEAHLEAETAGRRHKASTISS